MSAKRACMSSRGPSRPLFVVNGFGKIAPTIIGLRTPPKTYAQWVACRPNGHDWAGLTLLAKALVLDGRSRGGNAALRANPRLTGDKHGRRGWHRNGLCLCV